MQTYHATPRASSASQSQKQSPGIVFIFLFATTLFLSNAVQKHQITTAFVAVCSLFFDHFSVKTSSIAADIAVLILFALALYGLFCFIRFNATFAIIAAIIAVMAWLFLAPAEKSPEVKLKSAFPTLPTLQPAREW